MKLYQELLNNKAYLETVKEIEKIKFITDGKWDWEHGLGHFQRVAQYVRKILIQLDADERTIDLGMTAALLHDIGLCKGEKKGHALESGKIFTNYIKDTDITASEKEMLRQAIVDHSKGDNIQSLVGLALVLGDKLDVTYHRTQNSSIQNRTNLEIQKIKTVDIVITDSDLIVSYHSDNDFDVNILNEWNKSITIPKKVANHLGRKYVFTINDNKIDFDKILSLK